ncbi:hypothetical protein [Nocardia sp. NPDC058633]|uniref:hypothetical protein n=1 Tax=Nocardia sp. NPDC058633 TaxID=3346568 RepID=UPI003648B68E
MSAHVRPMRSFSGVRIGTVELITGGLLLITAALGMAGPLAAALLIRRSGSGRTAAVATAPLILLTLAVTLAVAAGLTLFAIARRRRAAEQAGSSRGPAEPGGA